MARSDREFRKLAFWRKAHEAVLRIYKETRVFPKEEQFGLTSQIRRAAVSMPANIAEGCGRGGSAELARFLTISLGSASEVDYHITLAADLGYWEKQAAVELGQLIDEVKRMITAYVERLRD